jgi:hypothetical protein
MRGKDKNRKNRLSAFMRYRSNKMTNRERNAFERELQKDPFSEEAYEGFTEAEPEEIRHDLSALQKQLRIRTRQKQRLIYYRIAASVAILMVIGSLFILIERNRSSKKSSKIENNNIALAIPEPTPLTRPSDKSESGNDLSGTREIKVNRPAPVITKEKTAKKDSQEEAKQNVRKVGENINAVREKNVENIISTDRIAASRSVALVAATHPGRKIKGKVLSSEDNQPVPGASIVISGTSEGTVSDAGGNFSLVVPDSVSTSLITSYIGMEQQQLKVMNDTVVNIILTPSVLALNEVVVTGYNSGKKNFNITGAVSKAEPYEKAGEDEYTPPEPVTGKKEFDRYIKENMRRPDILKEGEKATVVMSFLVRKTGVIDSIKIIRSPGILYSDEAIRLIREGPGWKPANEKGSPIDTEMRIRIVFK